jgi:hypothetical protein
LVRYEKVPFFVDFDLYFLPCLIKSLHETINWPLRAIKQHKLKVRNLSYKEIPKILAHNLIAPLINNLNNFLNNEGLNPNGNIMTKDHQKLNRSLSNGSDGQLKVIGFGWLDCEGFLKVTY